MLDVYLGTNHNSSEVDAPIFKSVTALSQMARYKRESGPVCKTLDGMDMKGQRAMMKPIQRKEAIDTASTSPASNSIHPDCSSGFTWSNGMVVTELRDVKGDLNGKGSGWNTDVWNASQSDFTSTNSGTNGSVDGISHAIGMRSPATHYKHSGTSEGSFKHVSADSSGDGIDGMSFFKKGVRSNSFSNTVSYSSGTIEESATLPPAGSTKSMPSDGALSYVSTQPDNTVVVGQYIEDLGRKRASNTKYPHETSSYTNNSFLYQPGPFGFPTMFRDIECGDVERSKFGMAPLTVFTAFSPSQHEENAIAVHVGDKVDVIARHNRWIYVNVAKSSRPEVVGSSGWIPEHALVEPEIFARQLHHSSLHTHTFNKFI